MKYYTLHFEGQIEVEAENEEEAKAKAWELVSIEDIGWWELKESDPSRM